MPSNISGDFEEELVIEGRILSGEESLLYLSKTAPVYSEVPASIVRNAEVTIIGKDGYKSDIAKYDTINECYFINTGILQETTSYAFNIELDGETYQSSFMPLLSSPTIDEVTYKENEDGISIHLSTYAEKEESSYYMWTYEEDWEFHADFDFMRLDGVSIYNNELYPLEKPDVNPYYYCWKHNRSSMINIYRTDNLKENTVKDFELLRIPTDDIRISYIYSILVKQCSITPEAYNYYKTLESYTENGGGLFPAMPGELRGNVSCISNPDIKVRGYVLASNVTTKRLFIYASDFEKIIPEYQNCVMSLPPVPLYSGWTFSWEDRIRINGYVASTPYGKIDTNSRLYSKECVDCRTVEGSTKKRPDFWPNNHE